MSGFGDGYVGTASDANKIRRLQKRREEEKRKLEELKKKNADIKSGLLKFGAGTSEVLEAAFKNDTIGLVRKEDFVERRANLTAKLEEELKRKREQEAEAELQEQVKKRKKKVKALGERLSFADEDFEQDEEQKHDKADDTNGKVTPSGKPAKLSKFGKDPTVETSFLPDREREEQEAAERERLKAEWVAEQKRIKNEPLQITYSYWDGTGHRRVITIRKGDTISQFLKAVQAQLAPEFREVRVSSVENLLYVKEDLIIPHQFSFYDLIINKARGKSGPLFHFDVHEDIRSISDATKEKDESHAGKVVERHWYEKNKHIFPASRWEIYDPTKKWERYTVHGE